jgi:hypothetical protein
MTRLGLELGATMVRALVSPTRGAPRMHELSWQPNDAERMVDALAALAGPVREISVAVGLAHLSVQRATLPPASAADQRRMLRMDLDRWFPLEASGDAAVGVVAEADLAFAARGPLLDAWVDALSTLAPVVRVEAAPVALARALAARGANDGVATVEGDADTPAHIELRNGALIAIRRQPLPDRTAQQLRVDAFDVARGALCGLDGDDATGLYTVDAEQRVRRRTQRTVATWAGVAVAAWVLATWAIGVSRDRTLAALDAEVTLARESASAGQASLDRTAVLDREAGAILAAHAESPDQVAALAALSSRLPASAVAQRVHVAERAWQVDGNAVRAAAVLEALAAVSQFENVHFLAPSTRYQDGAGSRETYSIGFALR